VELSYLTCGQPPTIFWWGASDVNVGRNAGSNALELSAGAEIAGNSCGYWQCGSDWKSSQTGEGVHHSCRNQFFGLVGFKLKTKNTEIGVRDVGLESRQSRVSTVGEAKDKALIGRLRGWEGMAMTAEKMI
jgi:hypothetical protein